MIRVFRENDLTEVMTIWLETNITAHKFILKGYWTDNYEMLKGILPQTEVYVYEDDFTNQIDGFIGLSDHYIAGLFVRENVQSNGVGKQLLDYAKSLKSNLSLSVYQKNVRAIQFYKREQFIIKSEHIDDSTGEKEFIMNWNRIG